MFVSRGRRNFLQGVLVTSLAGCAVVYVVVFLYNGSSSKQGHSPLDWNFPISEVLTQPKETDLVFKKSLEQDLENCVSELVNELQGQGHDTVRAVSQSKANALRCLGHVVARARTAHDPVETFLAGPVKYPHNYQYTINHQDVCSSRDIEVLFTVPSAPQFFQRRQEVRNSKRGLYAKDPSNKAVLVFFLGLPSNETVDVTQADIDAEALKYGDIVQSNFVDMYKNIRLKAVSMLKWVNQFCSHAKYVIRTDDDVNVTVTDLVQVMREKSREYSDFIIGRKMVNDVPARSKNKWHLSKEEYPASTFPPYVLGGLIGYPTCTVQKLYQATLRYPPIWLDDVYVTGLCAARLQIPVLKDEKFDFQHRLKA